MLCYLIYVKNMKTHFITSYVPNSKSKLHRTRTFCSMYELQYTRFFFEQKLLYATKVEVYTDSNRLVYFLSSAKLNTTGQWWVNELADFNWQIHYKPGRNHQDADARSWFPEDIHQYTSRVEQSSINAIFEGVQTHSENEETWLCAINTSRTAPETDTSPLHKNNLQ